MPKFVEHVCFNEIIDEEIDGLHSAFSTPYLTKDSELYKKFIEFIKSNQTEDDKEFEEALRSRHALPFRRR